MNHDHDAYEWEWSGRTVRLAVDTWNALGARSLPGGKVLRS